MANKKGSTFFSFISASGLASLKNQLTREDNENCPIRTLNQIIDPSIAVPKTNVSLRSLRSKPTTLPPSRSANNTTQNELSRYEVNASRETPISSNPELITEATRAPPVVPSEGNHTFAVPTMKAPRALKRDPEYWLNEVSKAAHYAESILEKDVFEDLCGILMAHLLQALEENGGEKVSQNGQTENQCDAMQEINNWLNIFQSSEESTKDYPDGPGFRDMDNISSVSGYAPYNQAGFMNNNNQRDGSSFVNFSMQYPGQYIGLNHGPTGSVVGFQDNMERFGPLAAANNSVVSCFAPRPQLLPAFFKQEGSLVGSLHQPIMYGNQPSFYHNGLYQPMMGYPPASMRSEIPSERNFTIKDPMSNFSMMSTHAYPRMNQTGRCNGSNMNTNNYNGMMQNPASSYMGLHYNQNRSGLMDQNHSERNTSKKIMAPLRPVVLLNRLEEQSGQDTGNETTDIRYSNNPYSQNPDKSNSHQTLRNVTGIRNPLRPVTNIRDTVLLRNVSKRINGIENYSSIETCSKNIDTSKLSSTSKANFNYRVKRAIQDTPIRNNTMNDDHIVTVTRSGRTVRVPQQYWSSDASLVGISDNVQDRGVKRKRNSQFKTI